jgi:EAL domain-containing protein (putative c-di-GMP-specific phosphodiesterase class I)
VERNELIVHYQAVQCLADDKTCGFEALVRWNHPVYGLLMPSDFISLAEENGLINQIDNWALTEACRQLREWQEAGIADNDIVISVNVSTKQFAQVGLIENVKRVLRTSGINPRCLQLEITESAMVKNLKNTAHILKELSQFGVSIALDDFGTGYSSLSYLHELPISTLKIDRSFISRMTQETDGTEIVRAIVALARNMKMKVIAEGIETEEQFEQLCGIDCDYGQGYLFSRPVSGAEAGQLLNPSSFVATAYQRAALKRSNLRLVSNG